MDVTAALMMPAPVPDQRIRFTVFQAEQPRRVSKAFALDAEGTLVRQPGGMLIRGMAHSIQVETFAEFAAVLTQLTPGEATSYGITGHEKARVVRKRDLAHTSDHLPVIARSRDYFRWSEGPGILMLDYDSAPDEAVLAPEAWCDHLYTVWPALATAPHLWRPSASSCIEHGESGEVLRGLTGQRLYVLVANARDIPRVGETLIQRLWLARQGRFTVSRSGALLERTLVDGAVWQPERLDFCGGAFCSPPLVQRLPELRLFNPEAPPIDTRGTLPPLEAQEKSQLAGIKRAQREQPELVDAVAAAQESWITARLEAWAAKAPDFDPLVVSDLLRRAVCNKRLFGDFPLILDDGHPVTVGRLLDQPDRYHNRRCADPLEPDYRGDTCIAWINLRNAGRPHIYSHAHGGQRFTLHRAIRTLRLIGGELSGRVQQVLELMRLDGTVFDRGGELVRVNETGQVFPVTPEWLTVHLDALIQFERFDARSGEWRAVDCPLDLAKRVIAMRGQYGLPRLHAVLTAPILTLDGRVLEQDGHDPDTGLLLILKRQTGPSIPLKPSRYQAEDAMSALWHPFKDFPFVGAIDRGVMLAALLTAVLRPVLPTAPGFLFTAPTAGSGKSLLALCLSLLVGADPPTLMPPTLDEEELRKRLLASLREGKTAMVFDNLSGQLDSNALCAFLTAREYGDRVLGASLTISVPATGLFLATGNNVALVGDLNRRLLTCRIDPQTDKPYRRAFSLDPERYVREHRESLVRNALTLVRGYLATGRKQVPDRTASFEDWSDRVRQTVLWVAAEGLLDVADPCDAIDASYEEDPETRKLAGLLACWDVLYGDRPKTVAEMIADATDPGFAGRVSPDTDRGRLQALLLEIAGEHGRINPRRLGRWIERMAGRLCDGYKFQRAKLYRGIQRWQVVRGGFGADGGIVDPYARKVSADTFI